MVSTFVDVNLVRQEQQWGTLSQRYNSMPRNNVSYESPFNALTGW
jgi:hypothetical protein